MNVFKNYSKRKKTENHFENETWKPPPKKTYIINNISKIV